MRKSISMFLVFSVLLLSGNMFAKERKGADLIIQKKDGQPVRGELIAVKKNSLLLKDYYSGKDQTVGIDDIRAITIVKNSMLLEGGLIGLLIGGIMGFIIGYPQGDEDGFVIISKPLAGGIGAAIGVGAGALIGAGIGSTVRGDKTIQIEGRSDSEIKWHLEKLRKKARIKNAQ